MKIALAGSFAHVWYVLNSVPEIEDCDIVAAAPFGPDDSLGFLGKSPATPQDLPVFDDYREMIAKTQPDLVSVFAPMYRIAEIATVAVEAGCHVIAEKPLATDLPDLERLRGAARDNDVHVLANLNMRGLPSFQTVRKAVADGKIGQPVLAFAQKSYPFGSRSKFYEQRETYGGSIPWQAIHALDFAGYCAGKDYSRVSAMQSNLAHPTHPGLEDNGGILLEFAGGGHAVVSFDYFRPFDKAVKRNWGDDRLRLVGTEAIVEVIDDGDRVILLTPTAREELPLEPARDVLTDFVRFLRSGEAPLLTSEESFRMTEVALKAREAADTGKVLEL